MKLQRPTQAELEAMSYAQKDALIMQLFDAMETLSARFGSRAFCIIRSVWETSKLRGQNPFEVLRVAVTA